MIRKSCLLTIITLAAGVAAGNNVQASLAPSFQFNGKGNWSLDGVGSNSTPVGTVQALVPVGSTVQKAFLYSSVLLDGAAVFQSVNFDGVLIPKASFTALGTTTTANLQAYRTDVTAQVASKVGLGSAVPFDFVIQSESANTNVDGELLAVIYSNPGEQIRTIAFYDGSTNPAGDSFGINFAAPLPNTTAANFEGLFSLGIGFGFQGLTQFSTVDVNGRRLTSAAGGQDDGGGFDGGLITVGGLGDSTANPVDPLAGPTGNPVFDDELYDLAKGNGASALPFLLQGDTQMIVRTSNPSFDDNIFFAGLNVTAEGSVIPEPGTYVAGLSVLLAAMLGSRRTLRGLAQSKT